MKKHLLTLIGSSIIITLFLFALLGPILSGYTYYDIDLTHKNEPPPSRTYLGQMIWEGISLPA